MWNYYPPSDENVADAWQQGVISIDASVLLNFHQYTEDAREAMATVLQTVKNQIFVPHQAALEYQLRRQGGFGNLRKDVDEVATALGEGVNVVRKAVDEVRKFHPTLEKPPLLETIDKFEEALHGQLRVAKESLPSARDQSENVRQQLDELIGSRVGPPHEAKIREEIEAEGKLRYSNLQPPGFKDDSKDTNQYGGLIFWKQCLDHARENKKPLLIITDELKDDWWWKIGDQLLGPHPELRMEARKEAGVFLWMYTAEAFVFEANKRLGTNVTEESLEEIGDASRRKTHLGWVQGESDLYVSFASLTDALDLLGVFLNVTPDSWHTIDRRGVRIRRDISLPDPVSAHWELLNMNISSGKFKDPSQKQSQRSFLIDELRNIIDVIPIDQPWAELAIDAASKTLTALRSLGHVEKSRRPRIPGPAIR